MIRPLALVVAFSAGLGVRELSAQAAVSYRVRVDSIAEELTRKEGEQALRDSIALTQIPHDTVRAGAFTIVTDTAIADVVRRSAARAYANIQHMVGRTSTALDTATFVAIPASDSSGRRPRTLLLGRLTKQGLPGMQTSQYVDELTLANVWEDQAAEVLSTATGVDVPVWLKGKMPIVDREDEWRDARIELVTARAAVARSCFRGDARSCASSLALVPSETPLLDWYDREERRDFIRRYPHMLRRQQNAARVDACVQRDDDQACEALAREAGPNVIAAPLGLSSHRSLVLMAFRLGGPSAYDRLVHADGTLEARLAIAAGVPADSLIRAWQRRVTEAPGAEGPLTTSTAVASLCWVTICALLALRSSRWR